MSTQALLRLSREAVAALVIVCTVTAGPVQLALAQEAVVRVAVIEDYSDMLTPADTGFNDHSGNMGVVTKDGLPYGESNIRCSQQGPCFARLTWNFAAVLDAFVGQFYSLFGLTDTQATFDGQTIETVTFPEHSLDLDDLDRPLIEPGGPRRVSLLGLRVRYVGGQPLTLRMELQDASGRRRFWRFPITGRLGAQTLTWPFRNSARYEEAQPEPTDLKRAKVISVIIERQHLEDGVDNPPTGSLDIQRLWFVPNRAEAEPTDDSALRDLLARRAVQYFLDWESRKAPSLGIPQDRSTFGDLLTVAGVGFGLPANLIAAERGWLTRVDAAQRTLSVLRILDNEESFGPERVGRIGHRGFFYHFFGLNGLRKQNFDFPDTPEDESRNTVELTIVDTALAVFGCLAAQSYFDSDDPVEIEIRAHAQAIYDRVDWPFMLDSASQQFYLGWKPLEERDGPRFEILDAAGEGHYSGTTADPATWDWYTDEVLLILVLALGSTTHPVPNPERVYCGFMRDWSPTGLIRSYPGSLFTYQFLHAFIDTAQLGPIGCRDWRAENWYDNSRQAMGEVLNYATDNPLGLPTYGPNAWGITACEGPDDGYHAYGAPPVASNPVPEQDGTICYYGMLSAAGYPDFVPQVTEDLRAAWARGHWHWRFALPDAFHSDVSGIVGQHPEIPWIRPTGPWVQRALFAIDQGPMALHFENARSGLIWNLLGGNPNIQRALATLPRAFPPDSIRIEGESAGTGDGIIHARSNASGLAALSLQAGQSRIWSFAQPAGAQYTIQVRYSNDNLPLGPLEAVQVLLDGNTVAQFSAQDSGTTGGGFDWNTFLETPTLGTAALIAGTHELEIKVTGGDGYGVEIDVVTLTRVP